MTLPTAAIISPRSEPGGADAAVMAGFAFTSMLSVVLFLAGMPLISMAVLAITGVSTIVLESAMSARRRQLGISPEELELPEAILALEARDAYRAILIARGDIRRVLDETAPLRGSRAAVLARCDAAVKQCGRLAVLGNPLQRYLEAHDRARTCAELERLRRQRAAAGDAPTGDALERAASARARQLETHDQIVALRERLCARLELARAALESFAATLVKLRVAGEEQRILTGDPAIDHLDGVGDALDDLAIDLEAELAVDLEAELDTELAGRAAGRAA